MRALDDAVEADLLGAPYQFQIVTQMRGDVARRVLAADDEAQLHRTRLAVHSGIMPFSASSFFALAFLSSLRPMPRMTLGALVNWMLEYSMTSMRLPQGSRKSRNGLSTILAPAASARAFTLDRSSTTKPIWRRSTPVCLWSGTRAMLMNWSPMSIKAARSLRPRRLKSKILPYQSSASSMSPTSIATWLMPISRGFLPSLI